METVIQIRVLFVAGSEQFFVEAAPGICNLWYELSLEKHGFEGLHLNDP